MKFFEKFFLAIKILVLIAGKPMGQNFKLSLTILFLLILICKKDDVYYMSRTVSARISDEEFEKILEYSNRRGISINEFLRSAISEKIKTQTNQELEKKDLRFGPWLKDLRQETEEKNESRQKFEQLGKLLGLS